MTKTHNYDELLSEEINKVSKRYPEVSFAKLTRIAVHFTRWQFEQDLDIDGGKFKPFDIVIYKPTGERGIVKSTNDIGAFVLFRIQSTAALCKYEDLELEHY